MAVNSKSWRIGASGYSRPCLLTWASGGDQPVHDVVGLVALRWVLGSDSTRPRSCRHRQAAVRGKRSKGASCGAGGSSGAWARRIPSVAPDRPPVDGHGVEPTALRTGHALGGDGPARVCRRDPGDLPPPRQLVGEDLQLFGDDGALDRSSRALKPGGRFLAPLSVPASGYPRRVLESRVARRPRLPSP